ncbi:MAG TPA: outer membrane lipoprotein carrier protein LolA [Verrucomicrobiae bacterium]|nr:outer membrane lipoprotein carrier protein LolA [Verrucomicrobiae bacterium]
MKKLAGIFIFAFCAAAFAATNELQTVADPQPLLEKLRSRMEPVKTVAMDFTQDRELNLFAEPLKSEGVMLMERPDKIRWETMSPYQTILLGDENSVAQFEFTGGKWQKLKLGFSQMLARVMQQMSAMNQGNLSAMTNDYSVSVSTNNGFVFIMVPKDEKIRQMISSLEIHLAPDLTATREVVMNEPNGDLTRITFSHEKHNVQFPARTFDQNKPLEISSVESALKNAP